MRGPSDYRKVQDLTLADVPSRMPRSTTVGPVFSRTSEDVLRQQAHSSTPGSGSIRAGAHRHSDSMPLDVSSWGRTMSPPRPSSRDSLPLVQRLERQGSLASLGLGEISANTGLGLGFGPRDDASAAAAAIYAGGLTNSSAGTWDELSGFPSSSTLHAFSTNTSIPAKSKRNFVRNLFTKNTTPAR